MLGVSIRTLRNKLHEYDGTGPPAEEGKLQHPEKSETEKTSVKSG